MAFSFSSLKAQLSGTKTIPTDYASIAAFVTDLNTVGVGAGGVTLNVATGYAETAPAGGFLITATGTVANPITIIGTGGAPLPIITASAALTVGNLNDAIFKIQGGDYVTISNLDLRENAANTVTAAATNTMTEWGIALLYLTTTDGAQNCSIIGNTITLNRTYQNTFGIYSNSTHALGTITTSATATTATGGNSGLKIYSNAISNVNQGIVVVGPTAAADHNDGIDIGGTSALTGNTITNYGTTGTFSSYANVSGTVNGILVRNSKNATVSYNTITSSVGGVTAGTLNGIQFPTFSTAPTGTFTQNINNNTISLNSGLLTGAMNGINVAGTSASITSTININSNNFSSFDHTTVTASGTIIFITQGGTHLNQSISNNTFTNINVKTTGNVTFISNSHTLPANGTKNVNGNSIVTAFNKSGAGGTITLFTDNGSDPTTATNNSNNNSFSNITVTGATTIAGFSNTNGGTPTKSVSNNTFSNWIGGTSQITGFTVSFSGNSTVTNNLVSNITSAGGINGISSASGTESFIGNTVHSLTSTGASVVNGISNTAGTAKIYASNKIYNLEANNAGGSVNGILISSGTSVTLQNNIIGDLRTPSSNAANPLNGINITGGSAALVYYNTVNLAASSSGALFGSSAISVSTTPNVTLRNNIFINESSFNGAAFAVAMRRSSTTLTSYNNASNNNLFYAGAPSANNLIMYDGTNSYQTMLAYQTAVLPRDANSFTGEAFTYGTPGSFFTSLTGSSVDFLRPVAGITTQVESGATAIVGVTTDFAGITRPASGTNPDMGAYEFAGVSPAPVITLNTVTPSATAQCVAAARTISVNVTTISGTITVVNLGYSVNGIPQANIPMTNTAGTTWEATLPVPTPANALIAWGVSATNSIGLNSSYIGTSYSDEPLTGVTASAAASIATVCAGSPSNLSAVLSKVGSSVSGLGTGTSSSSSFSPYYHGYGGVKTQFIYRASELTAMGFTAGNITSISLNVTTLGTPVLNSFTINIGNTAQTGAVTNTAILSGLTEIYNNAAQTLTLGTNLYTFSTPFNWDGTSNIVLSFNYSNFNTGGTSTTVTTDPAVAFTSSLAIYADNATSTCLFTAPASAQACMGTNSNSTSSVRPTITFTGNKAPAITSVTWMDGVTTVGTGNPLTVNPTTTTTYAANITSAGCVVSPAPTVIVTVNPLPTAPTALNSAQCGTQFPTASVTSTSGLLTPTFIWYDLAVAGTVLQNSTSTTFTSNVAATTTFYVAEVNTTTGCESPRVAVTVTVAIADGILAAINNATICIGSSVTLTATNTNATPNQSYTYTWTGLAGSGVVSVNGSSTIVTPTLPGTYTYSLAGADGGCNAVSSVDVTVNPFVAAIAPIDATCNAGNDGSFTLGATTCGTAPYTYSVDGGSYGSIPTNLIAGTYSVLVKDANGYISAALPLTITQPSITITNPAVTNVSVCQNSVSASVTASASTSVPTPQTTVVNFSLLAQPVEVNAAPGSVISVLTLPTLPAGAVITGLTLNCNGLIPNGGEYQSDARLGLSGAFTNAAAAGTGTLGFGTVAGTPYNYTRSIPTAGFPTNGGTLNLLFWDDFNDLAGADVTFPLGSSAATLTINYTIPSPATITWWNAATSGTQLGSGSPFETVGTSILPSTATPGVYTFYAQGQNGACPSPARTAVTVTVNALPVTNAGIDQTVCPGAAVTLTGAGANTYSWNNGVSNAVAFVPSTTTTYTVTGTDGNGCTSTDQVLVTINTVPSLTATATPASTCNGNSVLTAVAAIPAPSYCQPTYSSGTVYGDYISSVQLNTLNNVTAGAAAPYYTLYPTAGATTTTLTAGSTYTITLSPGTYTENDLAAWIDFNQNGTLTDVSEKLGETDDVGAAPAAATFTFTVPLSAKNGTTKLRVRDMDFAGTGTMDPCLAQSSYGETEDYTITIVGGVDLYTVTWSPATYLSSTSGLSVSASGIATNITYTATATFASGCTSSNTAAVTLLSPTTSSTPITACSSYTWTNGVTYTASGTHTQVLTNAAGCDSTATLVLTINLPTTSSTPITACDTYTWTNGVTYTASGTHTQVLTNAAGCDSTATLVLTINNSSTSSTPITACDTYTWTNGVTYTVSGTHTQVLTNAVGCDSTATLVLTINNSSASSTPITACDTYTWTNGVTYTVSGTHTQVLTNAVGCDSTATLVLTINNSTAGTDVQTACDSYTWIDGVTYTANNNSATFVLTNAVGCDSLVTLDLTINTSTTGTDVQTACDSYTWIDGVTYTASNNTATFVLTNAAGCDSLVTLDLTINVSPTAVATDNGDATITASTGTTYEWIDCGTGLAIAGATSQTYTVTANGSYSVVVSNGTCADTSDCVVIDYMNVSEMSLDVISLYPNPTRDNVTVTMSSASASIEIIDAQGKLLRATQVVNGDKIDLSTYETGMYIFRVKTENGTSIFRVSKN